MQSKGVFGVKRKRLDVPELEQIGFAFLPIWDPGEHYTVCGNYQLPVYAMGQFATLQTIIRAHALARAL
jgi:hypothetical protein